MKRSLLSILLTLLLLGFINSGCSSTNNEIIAKGKSANWEISITYKLEENMLYDKGNMTYLKNNPPKNISYEYVYPNGFPTGSTGTIEQYEKNNKEFEMGSGGGSINDSDNYDNLKNKIDKMSIYVDWEINGEKFNETIDLNVNE